VIALSGPGVACSAMRIRRLEAGELQGDERERTEAHLASCTRCRAVLSEIEAERAALARELPFPEFAAGVAERLAAPGRLAPRRPRLLGWAPLALAAGLAAVVAVPTVRQALRAGREGPDRIKGFAAVEVHVPAARGESRALAPGEPVPPGAPLRLKLSPAGRRQAAVALVDRDGAALLYAGPAVAGPLPGAFEWTGEGDGEIVVVLDDRPLDGEALVRRLGEGGLGAASPGRGAEVVVVPLRRGAR
jgi:hypothetical protein